MVCGILLLPLPFAPINTFINPNEISWLKMDLK
jgi:hypothetical protein